MTDSMSLVTAQVSFIDTHLALIHIDVSLYQLFLQPILQLLFSQDGIDEAGTTSWTNRHDFLNISITPEGCSIICTRFLADALFVPIRDQFSKTALEVEIVDEDYIVIQVDGQGLDAGQRVLELTSPLAMAGISIFFITTYFSDYILVPLRARPTVTNALEQRGFVFSKSAHAFVSQLSPSLTFSGGTPNLIGHNPYHHQQYPSSSNPVPTTPPAKSIPELQRRTFTKLHNAHILPQVDRSLRLVNCAGTTDDPASDELLKNDLLQVLLATTPTHLRRHGSDTKPSLKEDASLNGHSNGHGHGHGNGHSPPTSSPAPAVKPASSAAAATFLSLTLTSTSPISLFLETRLLPRLGRSLLGAAAAAAAASTERASGEDEGGEEAYGADPQDTLVPITFDLRPLPVVGATGIVCGVAGCLAQGWGGGVGGGSGGEGGGYVGEGAAAGGERLCAGDNGVGMSMMEVTFLSTAKAGTVLVKEADLERAERALAWGMREAGGDGGGGG